MLFALSSFFRFSSYSSFCFSSLLCLWCCFLLVKSVSSVKDSKSSSFVVHCYYYFFSFPKFLSFLPELDDLIFHEQEVEDNAWRHHFHQTPSWEQMTIAVFRLMNCCSYLRFVVFCYCYCCCSRREHQTTRFFHRCDDDHQFRSQCCS